jgi:hypothetical protein
MSNPRRIALKRTNGGRCLYGGDHRAEYLAVFRRQGGLRTEEYHELVNILGSGKVSGSSCPHW